MVIPGVTCGMTFVGCLAVILGLGTSVPVVLVVAVVLVSPSSVATEVCDGFSVESHWELIC